MAGMDKGQFVETVRQELHKVEMESFKPNEAISDKYWESKTIVSGIDKSTTNINDNYFPLVEGAEGLPVRETIQGWTTYGYARTYGKKKRYNYNTIRDSGHRQIDLAMEEMSAFARNVVTTKERLLAEVFNQGGIAAGHAVFELVGKDPELPDSPYPTDGLIYDGFPLFNLSGNLRSSKGGATYFNGQANALSTTNLDAALVIMRGDNAKNESDQPIDIVAGRQITLLVPPALEFTARQITDPNKLTIAAAGTGDTRPHHGLFDVVVNPWLTDTNAWFLVLKDRNGLIKLERQPLETNVQDFPQDRVIQVTAEFRVGFRIGNWRFVYGSNFSTS